jgi:hypothetical protein
MRTLRIALASLLLVAGCSTTRTGAPAPADEPASTTEKTGETTETSETGETSATETGSKRPRDIDIASLDPCTVLNKLPLRQYGLDADPPVGNTSGIFPGSKACFANSVENNRGLLVTAVVGRSAADYAETANAEVTEYDAQGYPLYVLQSPQVPHTCFGVLDVHDDQFIHINFGMRDPDDRPVTPMVKLCKTVPVIAASTVSALG